MRYQDLDNSDKDWAVTRDYINSQRLELLLRNRSAIVRPVDPLNINYQPLKQIGGFYAHCCASVQLVSSPLGPIKAGDYMPQAIIHHDTAV